MSYLVAVPEFLGSAATDLSNIGSGLSAANAAVFSNHGQAYQSLSAQAAAFHAEFVRALSGAGAAYSLTEGANAAPLQTVEQVINTPTNPKFPPLGLV